MIKLLKKDIKNIIVKIIVAAIFIVALCISSGLTRIVMSVLFLVSIATWFMPDRIKKIILIGMIILFIPLSFYANYKGSSDFPVYHAYNQRLYQNEFFEQKICPDVYIRELIRDKCVVIPYGVKLYKDYIGNLNEDERYVDFDMHYYRENNYSRYFQEYSKSCEIDKSLPKIEDMTKNPPPAEDFTEYGSAADMLRYSFLLNRESEKEMAYFWYSWFYYSFYNEKKWESHVKIMNGIEDSDTIIALWDLDENLYLMSPEYYGEKVEK